LNKESALFPVKTALSYIPSSIFGGGGGGGEQGGNFFTAPNPPFGAAITYNLKEGYRTKAQERAQAERAALAKGETPPYPTPEVLRAEAEEEAPVILISIADAAGKTVRRLEAPATAGLHRINWDLREQSAPAGAGRGGFGGGAAGFAGGGAAGGAGGGRGGAGGGRGGAGGAGGGEGGEDQQPVFAGRGGGGGALVVPGKYTVSFAKRINGVVTPLPGSQSFEVVAEGGGGKEDRMALAAFQEKVGKLQQALTATQGSVTEARTRLEAIRRAVDSTLTLPPKLHEQTLALEKNLAEIELVLNGDRVWRSHNEGTAASISEHVQAAASPTRGTTGRPTKTAMEQYQIASDELAAEIPKLRKLIDGDIKALEKQLDAAGAPPTPGRLPEWKGGK